MGPGLREILPSVSAGVAADVMLLPVGRRASRIMVTQTGLVVFTFIAEQPPEGTQPPAVANQPVPVIVANLVTKVGQQSAERLSHILSVALPRGIVRLGDVDGDDPERAFLDSPTRW